MADTLSLLELCMCYAFKLEMWELIYHLLVLYCRLSNVKCTYCYKHLLLQVYLLFHLEQYTWQGFSASWFYLVYKESASYHLHCCLKNIVMFFFNYNVPLRQMSAKPSIFGGAANHLMCIEVSRLYPDGRCLGKDGSDMLDFNTPKCFFLQETSCQACICMVGWEE